jgi:hypothetical protein
VSISSPAVGAVAEQRQLIALFYPLWTRPIDGEFQTRLGSRLARVHADPWRFWHFETRTFREGQYRQLADSLFQDKRSTRRSSLPAGRKIGWNSPTATWSKRAGFCYPKGGVPYALERAQRNAGIALSETEQAYLGRTTERDAYKRAMDVCLDRKAWFANTPGQSSFVACGVSRTPLLR